MGRVAYSHQIQARFSHPWVSNEIDTRFDDRVTIGGVASSKNSSSRCNLCVWAHSESLTCERGFCFHFINMLNCRKGERVFLKRTTSAFLGVTSHHHSTLCIYQSFRQQNGPYSVDWGWKLQLLRTLSGDKGQHSPSPNSHTHTHAQTEGERESSSLFVWCLFCFNSKTDAI